VTFDANHWFWWLLTAAVLAWYSTITVYVSVKGVRDIRGMLDRLKAGRDDPGVPPGPPAP